MPACLSLLLFAWALTRVEADHAGRAFAAYGGIYIAASLLWLWLAEGTRPDRWDVLGAAICLVGAPSSCWAHVPLIDQGFRRLGAASSALDPLQRK